jgi:energy-coupling factor transporter transmembrane protein EcfT
LALVIVAAVAFFFGLPAALTVLGVFIIMAGVKWIWKKIKGIGLFASGGMANNGMAIVGEKGPELVSLPRGSRVHSNSNSRRMNSSGTVNNFNITINAKDSSKAEMRRMADEIGRMINSKINRSTSSSTFR